MSALAALLVHVGIIALALTARAGFAVRQALAYTFGTKIMPVNALRPLLLPGDRELLDSMNEMAEHMRPLRAVGARLPGLFQRPALVLGRPGRCET